MILYEPPQFALYEFDDSSCVRTQECIRWLPSWHGPQGYPAQEVCLGWADLAAQVAVSTTPLVRHRVESERRYNAAFLALGGNQLNIAERPTGAGAITSTIDQVARDQERWRVTAIPVDDSPQRAAAASIAGNVRVGSIVIRDVVIIFATVDIDPPELSFRTLTPAAAQLYEVSPLMPADRLALEAQHKPRTVP